MSTLTAAFETLPQPSRFWTLHQYRQQLRRSGALNRLSQSAALVLLALADFADPAGNCWPSVGRIVAENPVSERSARRALRELEAAGLLVAVERPGHTTLYRLVMDAPTPATPATMAPLPGQYDRHPGQRGPQNKSAKPRTEETNQEAPTALAVVSPEDSFPINDEAQEAAPASERLPADLYEALKRLNVRAPWRLAHYGEDRIREVLTALARRAGVKDRAAWLVTALRDNWSFDAGGNEAQADTATKETRDRIDAATAFKAQLNTPDEARRSKLGLVAAVVTVRKPSAEQLDRILSRHGVELDEWTAYVASIEAQPVL